jgi:hypothetical protein
VRLEFSRQPLCFIEIFTLERPDPSEEVLTLRKSRAMDSSLAGSGLLIGFLLCLGLTQDIAQRESHVGQNPEQ